MRYAITFDLSSDALATNYHNSSYNNAWGDVAKVLKTYRFHRQQKSVYFGEEGVSAVDAVLAVQDIARTYAWFAPSIIDIRLLRVDDDDDLLPAIHSAAAPVTDANVAAGDETSATPN